MQDPDSMTAAAPQVIHGFPFGILAMTGKDSIDFLQRITSNDLAGLAEGQIQKTLIVSDKGRIIDAVWVIKRDDRWFILTSREYTPAVRSFLEKYIIMDDVTLNDVSDQYSVDLYFGQHEGGYRTDYFGIDAVFDIYERPSDNVGDLDVPNDAWETWRIMNGIPKAEHEIIQDFNPLELNLWNWISFTKGCYIGQEVIARLDTYGKIQRSLCSFTSKEKILHGDILCDENGTEIGMITSVIRNGNTYIGLCVVRFKYAVHGLSIGVKEKKDMTITLGRIFQKGK